MDGDSIAGLQFLDMLFGEVNSHWDRLGVDEDNAGIVVDGDSIVRHGMLSLPFLGKGQARHCENSQHGEKNRCNGPYSGFLRLD